MSKFLRSKNMIPQPAKGRRLSDRLLWFLVFLFIFLGSTIAGWNYVPSSTTRRGGAVESSFVGLGYILGQPHDNDDAGLVLTGRFLTFLALAVAGFTLWRRFRKSPQTTGRGIGNPHDRQEQTVPVTGPLPTMPHKPTNSPSAPDRAGPGHQPQTGQQGFPNPFNQNTDHQQ
jgi:hypothetical protein